MRNIIRHLTKSKAEKQAELISAYVDRALPARAQQQFEQALAHDAGLQEAVRQQRAIQAALRQLPRQRAPRSFALDPALYGRAQMPPVWQPFPILRAATALAMLLLVAVLAFDLGVARPGSLPQPDMAVTQVEVESFAAEPAEEAAMAPAAAEEPAAEQPASEEPAAEQLAIQEEGGELIATVPTAATEEALASAAESANAAEDQATATDSAGEAAPSQGALESEAVEGAENSLGMARILTETTATAAAVPTLESAPPPMPTAAIPPAATDTAAAAADAAITAPSPPAGIAAAPAATASAPSTADQDMAASPPAPLLPSRTLFLAAEIFLGAAVLGLALAAWWARRRS